MDPRRKETVFRLLVEIGFMNPQQPQKLLPRLHQALNRLQVSEEEIHLLRQGNCCRLDIRDHGPGVAAEHLARLGEPFFRAPGQSSTGHGLGLAIARRAAERLGGSLVLSNHAQGGLLASLLLPLE